MVLTEMKVLSCKSRVFELLLLSIKSKQILLNKSSYMHRYTINNLIHLASPCIYMQLCNNISVKVSRVVQKASDWIRCNTSIAFFTIIIFEFIICVCVCDLGSTNVVLKYLM